MIFYFGRLLFIVFAALHCLHGEGSNAAHDRFTLRAAQETAEKVTYAAARASAGS